MYKILEPTHLAAIAIQLHTRGLRDVAVNIGREAAIFGRASSCTEPVLIRPNEASTSLGSSSWGKRFRITNETSQARPDRLLSPGCAGEGQVGRDFGRLGPSCSMMRRTRANKPNGYLLGSYRIATAPEPNSSRLTSLKSTRFDSPANNVGPCPLAWDVPRTRTHRSIPAPPTPAGASRQP